MSTIPIWDRAGLQRAQAALSLGKATEESEIRVFLMADAVLAAKANQKTPDGYYNVERMLKGV